MELIKMVAIVWLVLLLFFGILIFCGVIIEKYINETHPIKKWWRKQILTHDDLDNWTNIQP